MSLCSVAISARPTRRDSLRSSGWGRVPTPGAVGGFHAAFRYGATAFFAAPDDAAVGAAIVLHIFSIGPALLLGLFFAAREGLNLGGMRRLAEQAGQGNTA